MHWEILLAALGTSVVLAMAGHATADRPVPPITEIKNVAANASVFENASRQKPIEIRSEEDAGKHFGKEAVDALKKQVNFKQQVLLVFAWKGSGQDRLDYAVAESFPEQIFFSFTPGRTRDFREHVRIYALRSNVRWSPPAKK